VILEQIAVKQFAVDPQLKAKKILRCVSLALLLRYVVGINFFHLFFSVNLQGPIRRKMPKK
jgi:hypothetical protein